MNQLTVFPDREVLLNGLLQFDYPGECRTAVLETFDRIMASPEAADLLKKDYGNFFGGCFPRDEGEELEALKKIAGDLKLHPYTVYTLFFLLCAPETLRRYREAGIEEKIFFDTMKDLKYKTIETHRIWGIWGVFCGDWYAGFHLLRRFWLERLEFELVTSEIDYASGGYTVQKGDPLLMVHIPEAEDFRYGKVLDSYKKAAEFYKDVFRDFPDGRLALACESWMLYPEVMKLYPEGNLKRFTADFDVIKSEIDPEQDDRWRIFHMPNETDIREYPENTMLQKKLKAWLLSGNRMQIGTGVFFFADGCAVPHKGGIS